MCQNCYIDRGSPRIINERTEKAADLIDDLYDSPDGSVGGYAHCVTDDWNLETGLIQSCLEAAKEGNWSDLGEETRQASIACLEYLLTLSEEERASALAIQQCYITA